MQPPISQTKPSSASPKHASCTDLNAVEQNQTIVRALFSFDGQTSDVHSISAGLDYPGVGPEHSYWKDTKRVEYTSCRDDEAIGAFDFLARNEGILTALETCHAVAKAAEIAKTMSSDQHLVICLSGRGDKDAAEIARLRSQEW